MKGRSLPAIFIVTASLISRNTVNDARWIEVLHAPHSVRV